MGHSPYYWYRAYQLLYKYKTRVLATANMLKLSEQFASRGSNSFERNLENLFSRYYTVTTETQRKMWKAFKPFLITHGISNADQFLNITRYGRKVTQEIKNDRGEFAEDHAIKSIEITLDLGTLADSRHSNLIWSSSKKRITGESISVRLSNLDEPPKDCKRLLLPQAGARWILNIAFKKNLYPGEINRKNAVYNILLTPKRPFIIYGDGMKERR